MDYNIIQPRPGYLALKESKEEKKALKTAGDGESNAYGKVIAIGDGSPFELGQLLAYNEFEGQELMKYGNIKEDNIIIIREEEILAIIL